MTQHWYQSIDGRWNRITPEVYERMKKWAPTYTGEFPPVSARSNNETNGDARKKRMVKR